MSEAPERITAWLSKDGSTRFEGGKLFPAGVEVEYVRADRIEELETLIKDALTDGAISDKWAWVFEDAVTGDKGE